MNRRAVAAGLEISRAHAGDNETILRFMQRHSMDAGIALRFDRAPDYFALHDAHSKDHETWLLWSDDELVGIGSFVVRQGWINANAQTVIYLADLRLVRRRGVAGMWRRLMKNILVDINARTGASHGYCSILRDNRSGRHALLNSKRPDSPHFQHLRGYSSVSIVARKPWAVRPAASVLGRRARTEDTDRLRDFVNAQSRQTQFGPMFDPNVWRHRLDGWPDFGLENFYVALNDSGELVGCLAPWDSSAINRIVIERLPFSANLVRHVCNLFAPITRRPRVRTGQDSWMPDITLTHIFIENRSPEVFASLLYAAQKDIFSQRHHATVSLCLYDGDPLVQALRSYWYVSVPMDLYWLDVNAVVDPQAAPLEAPSSDLFPGFESYLV